MHIDGAMQDLGMGIESSEGCGVMDGPTPGGGARVLCIVDMCIHTILTCAYDCSSNITYPSCHIKLLEYLTATIFLHHCCR